MPSGGSRVGRPIGATDPASGVGAARWSTFSSLQFRNYRLHLVGQVISFSGTWAARIAMAWLVLDLTGSGAALGVLAATEFVPTLLLAPVGGVAADRLDRRTLLTATNAIAAAVALLLGLLAVTGSIQLWMIFALSMVFGGVTAFDNPSRQTFVVELVGEDELLNAVTLNSVVINGARVVGPAIGGVLIATVGVGACFLLNAGTFLVTVVALRSIDPERLFTARRSPRGRGQIKAGLRYACGVSELRTTLTVLVVIGTLTYEFTVTLPMLAEFTFAAGPAGLAALTSMMGVGAVVGGLITASVVDGGARNFVRSLVALGVVVSVLSLMPSLRLAMVMIPFVGGFSVTVIALSNVMLQLNANEEYRGRVMSLFSVALIGSTALGGPVIGVIGEQWSPRLALGLGGVAAIGAALVGHFSYAAPQDVSGAGTSVA